MEAKIDRRKIRTRKMLHDAIISLIIERDFDSLTIEDITNRADLRRATFYLHYKTKEELLIDALQETFDELVREMEPLITTDNLAGKTQVETYAVMFRHAGKNSSLYRVILNGRGGTTIARNIRAYLAGHIEKALRALPQSSSVPAPILSNYMAGAELSLITWWLDNGQPYPAEEMAAILQRLTLHGVMGMLGENLDGMNESLRLSVAEVAKPGANEGDSKP